MKRKILIMDSERGKRIALDIIGHYLIMDREHLFRTIAIETGITHYIENIEGEHKLTVLGRV